MTTGINIESAHPRSVEKLLETLIEVLDGSNDQATKERALGVLEVLAGRMVPQQIHMSNNVVNMGQNDWREEGDADPESGEG